MSTEDRSPSLDDQMVEAVGNMRKHATAAGYVDRTDWTDAQWVADADALMNHIDGSIMSLVNGHVMALIRLRDQVARLCDEPDFHASGGLIKVATLRKVLES